MDGRSVDSGWSGIELNVEFDDVQMGADGGAGLGEELFQIFFVDEFFLADKCVDAL